MELFFKSGRLFILLCCGCISFFQAHSQNTKSQHRGNSFSEDTSLIESYIRKMASLPNVFSDKNLDTIHFYLPKIYSLSQAINYNRGMAEYYRILATEYNSRYLYDSSKLALDKEMYWALRSSDHINIVEAYAAYAIWFEHKSELDSAAKYYIKAVNISDSLGNKHLSGGIYNNLSIIYYNIKDAKNAEKYALAGYKTGVALQDSTIFLSSLLNLAGIKKDLMQQNDTALVLYEQVKNAAKNSAKYYSSILNATINEGDILSSEKKYTQALAKYQSVLSYRDQFDKYMLGYVYSGIGNTYFEMKNYAQAEVYTGKAIQTNKEIQALQELSLGYEAMSAIKKAQKQYEQALLYRDKYDSINDTLTTAANKKNMHLLETKFQTAKKDKQIAQQHLALIQNQRSIERKNTWMLILLGSLGALIAILILSVRSYRHKKKLHEQSLLAITKQHELETLKAKMDAREEERNRIGKEMHDDVGSALTTILYLSDDLKNQSQEKNKNIADRISGTAGMVVDKMNEIIWSMNREYDSLDDLIAYTRVHAARFLGNHKIDYHFTAPDPVPDIHLQGEQRRNIYLVIKESLHNIVKHAGASEVDIDFCINGSLKVTIHDNGKGIDNEKLRRFGNGLRNMKQRMESVGGSFKIENSNGSLVTLIYPLEEKKV